MKVRLETEVECSSGVTKVVTEALVPDESGESVIDAELFDAMPIVHRKIVSRVVDSEEATVRHRRDTDDEIGRDSMVKNLVAGASVE